MLTINQAHPVVQLGSLASLDEEDLGLGGQRGAVPGFESPPELLRFVGPIFGKDFALETVAGVGKVKTVIWCPEKYPNNKNPNEKSLI